MTERLNHKLNVDAIKTVKDVKNVFYTMELVASVDVDNPIYEVAKEYFTIPYVAPELKFSTPRKSIEEIQQEFDEKIDKLIKITKGQFEYSKIYAEKGYDHKFDKIIENFEYARKTGSFPPKLTLDYSKLTATGSSNFTSSFVIKEGGKEVGYYTFGSGYLNYYKRDKPNFIIRFCMDKLLGFKWIDDK